MLSRVPGRRKRQCFDHNLRADVCRSNCTTMLSSGAGYNAACLSDLLNPGQLSNFLCAGSTESSPIPLHPGPALGQRGCKTTSCSMHPPGAPSRFLVQLLRCESILRLPFFQIFCRAKLTLDFLPRLNHGTKKKGSKDNWYTFKNPRLELPVQR